MNKTKKTAAVVLVALFAALSGNFPFASSTLYAAQATVPNTFVAGTAANASEVNANFTSANAWINQIASRTFVLTDANDVEIGTIINLNPSNNSDRVRVINQKGFIFEVDMSVGRIWQSTDYQFVYGNTNCTGELVSIAKQLLPNTIVTERVGYDSTLAASWAPYYMTVANHKVTVVTTGVSQKVVNGTTQAIECSVLSETGGSQVVYKLLPNNSAVTGVTSSVFKTPLTIKSLTGEIVITGVNDCNC